MSTPTKDLTELTASQAIALWESRACEHCESRDSLKLVECGGGAAGDVYLCPPAHAEHMRECEECEPEMVEKEIQCPECAGEKTVERTVTVRMSDDPYEGVTVTCPTCQGEGIKIIEVCSRCDRGELECKCLDGRAA